MCDVCLGDWSRFIAFDFFKEKSKKETRSTSLCDETLSRFMCFRRFRVRFLFQTRARLRENKRERFKGVKKTKTVENLKRFFRFFRFFFFVLCCGCSLLFFVLVYQNVILQQYDDL